MGGIEAKVFAGSGVTLVAGWITDLLISLIPWLHQHLTVNDQREMVLIIAWGLGSLAAYLAPHTHRPDLAPVQPTRLSGPIMLPGGYSLMITGPNSQPSTTAVGTSPPAVPVTIPPSPS